MIEIISSMMNAGPLRAIASLFDRSSSLQEPDADATGSTRASTRAVLPRTGGIRFGDAERPVGVEAFMNF